MRIINIVSFYVSEAHRVHTISLDKNLHAPIKGMIVCAN